jgi:putative membrane protein
VGDHGAHAAPGTAPTVVLAAVVLALALAYLGPALRLLAGGRWDVGRTACWAAGVAAALAALLVAPAGADPVAHMTGHLLLGMLAPLLLVLADPVGLALRALPVRRARTLVALLRTRPVRVLTHPVTAAVLDVGGLWLLYRTPLMAASMTSPALHVVVSLHVLAAGCLFTHAVVGHDPTPGRASRPTRAVALVGALAAHGILAKVLWRDAATAAEQAGALIMYYGGDVVDVALVVLLCREWYRATAPRRAPVGAPRPA